MISFIRLLFKNDAIRASVILFSVLFSLPTFKAKAVDASILPQGVTQFLDDDGNPLSNGKVYFYVPNTLTFKTTWQNAAKSITNTNPVDLDAGGRAIIYGDGIYRQIVKDSLANTIYDAVTTAPLTGGTATLVGDGNLVSTVLPWSGLVAPAQYVFGYGQEIARATYPDFFTAITSTQTVGCTLGSSTITGLADTSQLIVGTAIELSCVAAGTTVLSKTLTTVVLSANSSASTSAIAVFFPWGNGNGSTTFNVPDLRGYNLAGRDNMGGTASARLANGNGLGRPLGIANFTYTATSPSNPTRQVFLATGAGTYNQTSSAVTKIVVTMVGGGGGGGAITTNNGATGTTSSFNTDWTTIGGSGGGLAAAGAGIGGTGGTGGANGASGNLLIRLTGGGGGTGTNNSGQTIVTQGGMGGNNPFGGGGRNGPIGTYTGQGGAASTGAGGGGASGNGSSVNSAGGGGAGEYVQFQIVNPAASYNFSIGAGGAGGAAGTFAGGAGGSGIVIVDEYYTTTPSTTSFTATTAGTLEQQRTINYVVKVTPDTSTSIATGVASLGGMTGVITCGTGITCTGNSVTIAPTQFYTTLIASAQSVNLNSANTDNAMTVTLPAGTTNYRITAVMVQNNGTTASLTTATAGLFSAAAGGGLALAANQALSAITANAVNTDANSLSLTQTIASRTTVNSATLYFRVGTAQGAASTANVYVYAQPMP